MRWPVPEKVKPPCVPAQGILTVPQNGAELAEAITRLRRGYGGSPRHFSRRSHVATMAKSAYPRASARGILAKVSKKMVDRKPYGGYKG
jgi:hypothetical protein